MNSHIFSNYNRYDIAFERGDGCYLFDQDDKRYLDFATGIATNALGYQHPVFNKAMKDQMEKLVHCSNLYHVPSQEKLAALMCQHSFAEKVLFTNSGLEANEAALRMIRKYQHETGRPERARFIAIGGAYHGRSFATISASPVGKMVEGFQPLPDWFDIAPADDLEALEQMITPETSAILLEPLQGEGGGVHLFSHTYLRGVKALCEKYDLILFFDEIQCGNGRTGKLWCYEHSGVIPDIMTTAKGMGNGVPIGAVLTRAKFAAVLTPGSHGSTYAGGPLVCTVAHAVFGELAKPELLKNVTERGVQMSKAAAQIVTDFPSIFSENLGIGLMQGLRCHENVNRIDVTKAAMNAGILIAPIGGMQNVIRLLPPLIISETEMNEGITLMRDGFRQFSN